MSIHNSCFTLAALAVVGAASSVHAAAGSWSDGDKVFERVSLAGLHVTSEADAKAALLRIRSAAERVCVGEPDVLSAGASSPYRLCVRSATNHAVASLGSPLVAALNAGHGHQGSVLIAGRR
jgi:UrcA family protein